MKTKTGSIDKNFLLMNISYDRASLFEFCESLTRNNMWEVYKPKSFDANVYKSYDFNISTYRYKKELLDIPEIKRLAPMIKHDLTYQSIQLLNFPPFHGPVKHRDIERETGIILPISPNTNYCPILFYPAKDDPPQEVHYENNILVFNAKTLHAVINGSEKRYNLQFDLDIPFIDIRRKIINRELMQDFQVLDNHE